MWLGANSHPSQPAPATASDSACGALKVNVKVRLSSVLFGEIGVSRWHRLASGSRSRSVTSANVGEKS